MSSAPDHHAPTDYHAGKMNIDEQSATFLSVVGLFKWGSLALAAILILLIFWFCTPAGFLSGLIVAAIVTILGAVVLRGKKSTVH